MKMNVSISMPEADTEAVMQLDLADDLFLMNPNDIVRLTCEDIKTQILVKGAEYFLKCLMAKPDNGPSGIAESFKSMTKDLRNLRLAMKAKDRAGLERLLSGVNGPVQVLPAAEPISVPSPMKSLLLTAGITGQG